MYPSSSSSSSSHSHNSTISHTAAGLTRYGSAPSSLLTSAVDAVIGGSRPHPLGGMGMGMYFSQDDSSDHSACKLLAVNNNASPDPKDHRSSSYPLHDANSALLRQRSSPAGFLSHLASSSSSSTHPHLDASPGGFTITRGTGGSRLKSQLSFTGGGGGQDCLSDDINLVDPSTSDHHHHHHGGYGSSSSSAAFAMVDPWDTSNSNSIAFSAPSSKRPKNNNNNIDADFLNSLHSLDSQYSMPQTSLEMAAMEKHLLHIPEDSVPCKIRAKRGCATHPRSIAERERRTRISGKLKKLQDLVPNMDKQTSYSDMLDLAVQHIKGLQCQVKKLHTELESCTCGCKPST